MIEIVQIGHHRLNLRSTSADGIKFDTGTKFRRTSDKLTHVPGVVTHSDPGLPLVDDLKWKVSGTLICGEKGCGAGRCNSVWNEFQSMLATAGGPVRIIGVVDVNECYCEVCGMGTGASSTGCCSECGTLKFAQWMTTSVEVTNVKRTWEWENGQPLPYHLAGVEMELEGAAYWEPLDDLSWKWWNRNLPSFTTTLGVAHPADLADCIGEKQYHPRKVPRMPHCTSGFQYRKFGAHSGPGVFAYPENWYTAYFGARGEGLRAFMSNGIIASPNAHVFTPPVGVWNAPPRSMYYFGDFWVNQGVLYAKYSGGPSPYGTLGIQVTGVLNTGWEVENSATLDLEDLDTNLANDGHTGILEHDRIIVGLTAQGGGWYLRREVDGSYKVLDTYVPWQYDGYYPGQTYAGHNIVNATGPAGEHAYLHVFRSY